MLVERVSVLPSSPNNHHAPQEAKSLVGRVRDLPGTSVRHIIATLLPPQPRYAFQRNVTGSEIWPRRYMSGDIRISIRIERGTTRRDTYESIGLVTRRGAAL